MKKKIFVSLLLVFVLILCDYSICFCKGELGDGDAFISYMGKTKSEVRRLSSIFEEISDNMYFVDRIEEDDEYIGLMVVFGDYNLVEAVGVVTTKGAMSILGAEPTLENAAAIGAVTLGFSGDDVIRSQMDDDGDFVIRIKGGITIVTSDLGDDTYAVLSFQN